MKHITFSDTTIKKKNYDISMNQFEIITLLYEKNEEEDNKNYKLEIRKKLSAYKNQDKLHNKYDKAQHITFEQTIQKLYDSKLKCYYCNNDMLILYNKKREGLQWTLERLNNNIGHYNTNTCISCLKCNLQRRTDNHEYFKNGKQFKCNIIR
jgi:hypothetical protein